ncbi:hypothetical protein HMPREF9621_02598 [Cutibacterium modestum HL037PA2]|nr:hypothetical protein HMPREF9621_02598 [Cutibacterium modestum HL037PA2]
MPASWVLRRRSDGVSVPGVGRTPRRACESADGFQGNDENTYKDIKRLGKPQFMHK